MKDNNPSDNGGKKINKLVGLISVLLVAVIVVVLIVIFSEDNGKKDDVSGDSESDSTTVFISREPSVGGDYEMGTTSELYNELFSMDSKVLMDFDITDENLIQLQEDYENGEDVYRPCTMTVDLNGTVHTMEEVGIRIKGNTSRVPYYNDGDLDDRNLVHFKVKFNATFDNEKYGDEAKVWENEELKLERKDRRFADLEELELKWNRNFDSTFVANVYINDMFRDLGMPAQRTSLANIKFGGYNYGVYTIYESMDKLFLERNFGLGNEEGELYKCAWGQTGNGVSGGWSGATYLMNTLNSIGIDENGENYIYALKTNKKTSTFDSMRNLIETLNSGEMYLEEDLSNTDKSKEIFESVVDEKNWIKFAAISYFVGNPDDLRNNYNNHCVYFGTDGKARFIPYDNDRGLGITTSDIDMSTLDPYSDTAELARSMQENPLYESTVIHNTNNYTKEYTQALQMVYESGWLEYDRYLTYYEKAKKNYEGLTVPDENLNARIHDLGGNASYEDINDLVFAEENEENMAVKEYFENIKAAYEEYKK